MQLDDLRKNWEQFGESNPLWAINTAQEEWNESAFFKTGEEDIERIFDLVERCGIDPQFGSALDFGCGVGRLSLALARRFERVDGVDISRPMIEKAERFREVSGVGERSEVNFHVNTRADLTLFNGRQFDFILSLVTLQHMKPEFALSYISEFCRFTGSGGVLVFQLPSRRDTLVRRLRGHLGRYQRQLKKLLNPSGPAVMEMYGISPSLVRDHIRDQGLEVVSVVPDSHAETWESYTYIARRD